MRASGILMHVTSLPGPNGIGAMGKPAHRFVDFLEQAGQKYWQVLPLSLWGFPLSILFRFCWKSLPH